MSLFISGDWGTSVLRLRLVNAGSREIYAEHRSDLGIAETWNLWLSSAKHESERIQFYISTLTDAISKFSFDVDYRLPIVLSGMASSSIGLAELPYQAFPFNWDPQQFLVQKIKGGEKFKHELYLVSGFKTDNDVMRGEETMLLGLEIPEDEQIVIFPGTHSKHVHVKKKTGIDFKTYMTGELFNLLAGQSILKTAVSPGDDEKSFKEGFMEGMNGNLLHDVFGIRSRYLLHRTDPVSNFQRLSGLIIGAELKELANTDCPVSLVCNEHLKTAYLRGLELQDIKRKIHFWPEERLLINGQCKIVEYYF
jgi:2-dehydro-3-deoxygalactonokinase